VTDATIAHLEDEDRTLVMHALRLLDQRYVQGRHEVAAAVRTSSGGVHLGMQVESSAGRATICAEGVAIGAAVTAGDREIVSVAAVLRTVDGAWRVVSPCGVCRELIGDYGPAAHVVDYDAGSVRRVPIGDLLPSRVERRWDR
jgi:cytidine deaminase